MSSDAPMPHFVEALEARLRLDAAATTPVPELGRKRLSLRPRRARVMFLAVAVIAVVTAAGLAVLPASPQRAYAGNIALLRTPPVDVSTDPHARAVALAIAPQEDLPRVWETAAFGGQAYLVGDTTRWCLSAPDPAADQPDIERGSTCALDADFQRIGIALRIGNNFIAVVPDNVRAPTLREPGKPERRLTPSEHGVVQLPHLPTGAVVTVYDGNGHPRSQAVHG